MKSKSTIFKYWCQYARKLEHFINTFLPSVHYKMIQSQVPTYLSIDFYCLLYTVEGPVYFYIC